MSIQKAVSFPITFPITFVNLSNGMVAFPITFPIAFIPYEENRTVIKLNTTIQCEYANETKCVKLPIIEQANVTCIKIPLIEKAWVFNGLLLEETVVGMMQKKLTLIDNVKSRLLMDTEMVGGNKVKLKWYGDEVPRVEVLRKLSFDETYDKVGVYDWGVGETTITLGTSEYNIMLNGEGDIGESIITTLGEPDYIEVDVYLDMPINEKMYSVEIDYTSKYVVPIKY